MQEEESEAKSSMESSAVDKGKRDSRAVNGLDCLDQAKPDPSCWAEGPKACSTEWKLASSPPFGDLLSPLYKI